MQSLGFLLSYQSIGLALLITGIVLVSRNKEEDTPTLGILCIVFGALLLISSLQIDIWQVLPKGPQQDHGDSSDFDMLGGKS